MSSETTTLIARARTYVTLQRERPDEPMGTPDLMEEMANALEELTARLRETVDLADRALGMWRSEYDVGDDWSDLEAIIERAREAIGDEG